MKKVTATTAFLGAEGMWQEGETREVSASRATELVNNKLAVAAGEDGQAANAPEGDEQPDAFADALKGAKDVYDKNRAASEMDMTLANTTNKPAEGEKEEKAGVKTKEEKAPKTTK